MKHTQKEKKKGEKEKKKEKKIRVCHYNFNSNFDDFWHRVYLHIWNELTLLSIEKFLFYFTYVTLKGWRKINYDIALSNILLAPGHPGKWAWNLAFVKNDNTIGILFKAILEVIEIDPLICLHHRKVFQVQEITSKGKISDAHKCQILYF